MTKKIVILFASALLVLASVNGCSRCRQTTCSWFNRGDKCCPPPACPPGMPQATMMLPTTPQVLPGPIEIAPSM